MLKPRLYLCAKPNAARLCPVLLAVCVLMSSGLALGPRFNPRDVVRQIRPASSPPSVVDCGRLSDDGEFLIDTSVTYAPAPGDQECQAVGFDGANFLVVWGDDVTKDICGARVTPQGTVLDPIGFVISDAANDRGGPAVSFDGASFLVVWGDHRSGSDYDIYGARVTPQGTVLDPAGFVVSQAPGDPGGIAADFDGANSFVVWHDNRSGNDNDIYGARVSPQGTVLDTEGIIIARAASDQGFPDLAFDGTNFLVMWQDLRSGTWDVCGARVTPEGTVLDTAGFVISQAAGDHRYPSVNFDGTNFLVAWSTGAVYYRDIYGARVAPEGTVLDPAGIVIARAPDDQADAAVDFDGANFLVTWDDYRSGWSHIYGARVTSAGVVLDPSGLLIAGGGNCRIAPASAFDGANLFVVWIDQISPGDDWDICGARVTPQGTVLDSAGIAIATAPSRQWSPALASDGADFLVVWQDHRGRSSWDIYGVRVASQGTVLDSAGFAISTAADWQESPALAFDGANFLVAWQDHRSDTAGDIYGARVTPQGTVLDSAGFVVSEAPGGQHYPAVAFDGADFLVVWEDSRSGGHIYGARVTPAGVVLDSSGFIISRAGFGQRSPVVGFDGTNYLVAWSGYGGDLDIYGARVTPAGVVLDSLGFAISSALRAQSCPSLAFGGSNFLVVWEDERNQYREIYGARVTPQGTVLDPAGIGIMQWAGQMYSPVAAFDGVNFLVVWRDTRNFQNDIYGRRVTPEGIILEYGPVVRQQGDQLRPRLCCSNGGPMLLVYQGWTGIADGRDYNTDRIWGLIDPNPGVAETPSGAVRMVNAATVVRGVLFLPSLQQTADCSLLSVDGRKVLDLHPGANDVRELAPGVYFMREEPQASSRKPQAVRKIVLTE